MKRGYYISNLDNEVHFSGDVMHNIRERENRTEISILSDEYEVIDVCILYGTLSELINKIWI